MLPRKTCNFGFLKTRTERSPLDPSWTGCVRKPRQSGRKWARSMALWACPGQAFFQSDNSNFGSDWNANSPYCACALTITKQMQLPLRTTHWYKHWFPHPSSTSNSGTGLSASPFSGGTRKRRRSSNPIPLRKSTQCRTASHPVGQLPTDNENEEEVEGKDENENNNNNNNNNEECEDGENKDKKEEETVKQVVEPDISSDTEDANADNDSASQWNALEKDFHKVSRCHIITFYLNAIHRCTRTE